MTDSMIDFDDRRFDDLASAEAARATLPQPPPGCEWVLRKYRPGRGEARIRYGYEAVLPGTDAPEGRE